MQKRILLLLLTLSALHAETLYQDQNGKYFVLDDEHIVCSGKSTAPKSELLSSDLKDLQKEIINLRSDLKSIKKCPDISLLSNEEKSQSKTDSLDFEANIRTGYVYLKADAATSTSSKAVGGNIGFTSKEIIKGVKAKVGFYGIEALSTNNSNDDFNIRAGDSNQSYGFIGEALLKVAFGDHAFNLGRQTLDTPHADGDDIRMTPDLFEAYSYAYREVFKILHISSMAGWENGVDQTRFINVHDVYGITDANGSILNSGITMVQFSFKTEDESFSIDLYDYIIHDAINTIYVEASYANDLSKDYTLTLSAQYDINKGTDTFNTAEDNGTLIPHTSYDAKVTGFSAALEMKNIATTLTLATNQTSGTDTPIGSLGGGAYYTSMEDSTVDGIGSNDATSNMLALEYDASKHLEGLALAYYYGAHSSADKTTDHIEQNFSLEYDKEDSYKITLAYTNVANASTAKTAGAADFTLFRAFLDIPIKN